MLFILTSEIQSGKSRWLENLIERFSEHEIAYAGVLAPGIWRKRNNDVILKERIEASMRGEDPNAIKRFEKLGINNILLPSNELIEFARRCDLQNGTPSKHLNESEKAGLEWVIFDDAVERVNSHLKDIEANAFDDQSSNDGETNHPNKRGHLHESRKSPRTTRLQTNLGKSGILIIDEIGRLELQHEGGLTAAMELLRRGPSKTFPHALIVVRPKLTPLAEQHFSSSWGSPTYISPTEQDAERLLNLLQ